MLKDHQYSKNIQQDLSLSSQIHHSSKQHQKIHSSLDRNFIQSIESNKNADKQYFTKMRALQMDQLDMGLEQYQKNKMLANLEKENERKDYRERVNGVLGQIEKNIMQRSRLFQSQLIKQEEKKKRFIDDNAIKQRKISQHVNNNYDKDVFFHESDQYQQYQNNQNHRTLAMQEWQKQQRRHQLDRERQQRQIQVRQRIEYEKRLEQQRKMDQERKLRNQSQYQLDLKKLVEEKQQLNSKRPEPATEYKRHNPITNPIQYHIENPYLLKRLQQYK